MWNSASPPTKETFQLHQLIENCVIGTVYQYCHHNQLQTARLLGISRNVVRAGLIQSGDLAPPPLKQPESVPVAEYGGP